MRKFTIFTFLLTLIVVVVAAEVVVTEYLPQFKKPTPTEVTSLNLPDNLDLSRVIETNVLGSDIDYSKIPDNDLADSGLEREADNIEGAFGSGFEGEVPDSNLPLLIPGDDSQLPTYEGTGSLNSTDSISMYGSTSSGFVDTTPSDDFEDDNYTSVNMNAMIREDMIASAGFVGASLEEETHNGFLYKTIYIDDLKAVDVEKYVVKKENTLLAKVYTFNIGPTSTVSETYEVLKMRASEGLDTKVNETNEFGDAAFYMNDARREGVAFLTVRFGGLIYGFSYPKNYHPQIKNLITLIDMEF